MFYVQKLVRDNWETITSFKNPIYHDKLRESTEFVLNMIDDAQNNRSGAAPSSDESGNQGFTYNFKDAILYALSLNFSTTDAIKFLYENHPDFCVFPTFGVIPAQLNLFDSIRSLELPKGVNLDLTKLLHGEQYLELYKPLASSDHLKSNLSLLMCWTRDQVLLLSSMVIYLTADFGV